MRHATAIVVALAVALPACAQRGGSGGHAGFGGGHSAPAAVHSAPAFHGSYAPATSYHVSYANSGPIHYAYSGVPLAHAPVSYPSSMRLLAPGVRYPTSAPIIRPTFYHPGHGTPITTTHSFIIRTYPIYPYAYPIYPYIYPSYVYGYLPPDMVDNSYDNFYSTQQPPPESGNNYPPAQPDSGYPEPTPQPEYGYPQPVPQPGYGYPQPMPQPEYGYPQPVPAYPQPQPEAYSNPAGPPGYQVYVPQPASPQMQYAPGSASTVILIYKDGRPPEQIQNYLATRSTLTVLDGGRRREIPLSDLNLPATISANRQTGVDFQLPTR